MLCPSVCHHTFSTFRFLTLDVVTGLVRGFMEGSSSGLGCRCIFVRLTVCLTTSGDKLELIGALGKRGAIARFNIWRTLAQAPSSVQSSYVYIAMRAWGFEPYRMSTITLLRSIYRLFSKTFSSIWNHHSSVSLTKPRPTLNLRPRSRIRLSEVGIFSEQGNRNEFMFSGLIPVAPI
jgi:hypothetical protein